MSDALLSVERLERHYPVTEGFFRREVGRVRAVDGVSFDLRRGETLGLVGESGCGKSTVARAVVALESPTAGRVAFDGRDVAALSGDDLKRFRRRVQMVFQDPTSSFDPRMTVGEAVAEPMGAHGMGEERRTERVRVLLDLVGLGDLDPERYPHELSGGQKQRAALARALSLDPEVLVLDEPVSALDVSVQAEILALVDDLQARFDLSVLLVSHDMSVVERLCDRVAVMYLGELVERGPTDALFDDPAHPYSRALLAAVPRPDPHRRDEAVELAGDVPDPADPPSGCRFHTRCPAVVPPDGVAVPPGDWRAVFRFRVDLRDGRFGVESVRDRLVDEGADPGDVPRGAVRDAVREEYDVPARLGDDDAERALADALDAALDGAYADAADRLAGPFATVCERETPAQRRDGARSVACHRHDGADSVEGGTIDDAFR